jgi:DNA polymerase-1
MATPAPLLAADVPWLLYRSYFALPKSIADGEGHPVNALLGTVNALLNVLDGRLSAQGPRCVVACMGAEEAKYRVALYPGYHAHRDPMPAELRWQWKRAPQLLQSLGWTYATSETLEADDVMFSYALAEQVAGGRALLMSGDRDMYGAVSDRVAVLELLKGGKSAELGPAQVRERYGIEPEQVPDLIALRGDPSDGLPGAPGVGAKTAAQLLREHGTLEQVLAAARALENRVAREPGPLRPRIAAALRENEQLLLGFKEIATLQRIELERPPDAVTDFAGGATCAREMGMRRLAERLEKLATA